MIVRISRYSAFLSAFGLFFALTGCEKNRQDELGEGDREAPVRTVRDVTPGEDLAKPVHGGECGRNNASCAEAQFCQFPVGLCGEGTVSGLCMDKPDMCAEVVDPVCGCDGQDYGNECKAWMAGVNVRSKGECATEKTPPGDENP